MNERDTILRRMSAWERERYHAIGGVIPPRVLASQPPVNQCDDGEGVRAVCRRAGVGEAAGGAADNLRLSGTSCG